MLRSAMASSLLARADTSGYVPFTEYPDMAPTVVFPRPGMQAFAAVIFLSGVTILSFITSRRSLSLNPLSVSSWRLYSWPRLVCLGVFVTSWLFLYAAGVLVLGIGMSQSNTSCALGIFSCIVFYALSKIFIYLFLIEKVHIVGNTNLPRLKSKLYILCLIGMFPYLVILVLMIIGRIAEITSDGACHIGLKKFSSLALLIYDLFLNVFLTSLFVWPILTSKFINPKIRAVATRTMLSALMALTTSTINILVLTLMHGRQLGFVCLGSCGSDVTINALVLFYVTWSPSRAVERDNVQSGNGGQKASQVTAVGGRSQKTMAGTPRGGKVGMMPRSDYTHFPEPKEEAEPQIDPEDGGGYAIPRDAVDNPTARAGGGGGAILARETAFSQKPFSMEDREKRRARGRINLGGGASTSTGGGFLLGVRRALGLTAGGRPANEEKEDGGVGMNSIQVHVETAVATAEFPGSPVRPPQPAAVPAFERSDHRDEYDGAPSHRMPFGRTESGGSEHILVPTLNVNGTSDDGNSYEDDEGDDNSTKGKQSVDSRSQLR